MSLIVGRPDGSVIGCSVLSHNISVIIMSKTLAFGPVPVLGLGDLYSPLFGDPPFFLYFYIMVVKLHPRNVMGSVLKY
jgi:hypothetical protein